MEKTMNLEDLKNKHDGERCFILGTGSSLNNTDLSLLENEILFGCNTLYVGMKDWNISCKYYSVGDCRVWHDHYRNILKLDSIMFLSEEIYRTYPDTLDERCLWVKTLPSMWERGMFSSDLTIGKFSGDNVIVDCLQEAHHLGFKKVYLVGCDWGIKHFNEKKIPDTTKQFKETGDFMYSMDAVQRFAKSTASCEICKRAYEMTGGEVINCTVGGNLEVFKRQRLENIVQGD